MMGGHAYVERVPIAVARESLFQPWPRDGH
jgi:hypothetical protein